MGRSHKNHFSTAEPSVPMRSHLGTFSGILREGDSITEGFYINTIASPMKRVTYGSIASSKMASSLSLILNTMFSSMFLEIYSM